MVAVILGIAPLVRADELSIDADSIVGENVTQLRASNARLLYGEVKLTADDLLYDSAGGWVQASNNVQLMRGEAMLRTDLLDYFPQLSRAIATGNVRYTDANGVSLWTHMLRYELDRNAFFLEGKLRLDDGKGNELTAATLAYDAHTRLAQARGAVTVRTNNGQTISAKTLDYDVKVPQIEVAGEVIYTNADGLEITGRDLTFNLADNSGAIHDIQIRKVDAPGVISASHVTAHDGSFTVTNATYTTCDLADPAWLLEMSHLELDNEQVAHARDVRLKVGGNTVAYLPAFTYILSNERRTGLLAPILRIKSGSVSSLEIPYYLNLAPHYDATLRPRLITSRGAYAQVSGRWLSGNGNGQLDLGGINDDKADIFRSHWLVSHGEELSGGYHFNVFAEGVSDDLYSADFFRGKRLSQRFFSRKVSLERVTEDWQLGIEMIDYQTIQPTKNLITEPYNVLPGVTGNWHGAVGLVQLDVAGSVHNFQRTGSLFNGTRLHSVSEASYIFDLGNAHTLRLAGGGAASNYSYKDEAWLVSYGTVDVRPQFWRNWQFAATSLRQVFEPRLFVGMVSREDFATVPVYDSRRVDESYQDFFAINSFVGGDRFEDSSFVSYGLDTKLWTATGSVNRLAVRLAQRYRLKHSRIIVSGQQSAPQVGFSNILGEVSLYPDRRNALRGRLEWSPDNNSFEHVDLEMQHLNDAGHTYRVRYSRSRNSGANDGELGFGFQRILSGNVQLAADINYDLEASAYENVSVGMRFISTCKCWSVNFFVEHEPQVGGDETELYIQLDLHGLGELGDKRYEQLVGNLREPL